MIIIYSCLSVVLAGSFFEWLVHALLMHGTWGTKALRDGHVNHHENYPKTDYRNHDHGENVNIPLSMGIFMVGVIAIPSWLISGSLVIGMSVAVTAFAYFLIYNFVHGCFHIPAGRRFEKTKLFQWMCEYHRIHHALEYHWSARVNICLVFPLADWVFSTMYRPKRW